MYKHTSFFTRFLCLSLSVILLITTASACSGNTDPGSGAVSGSTEVSGTSSGETSAAEESAHKNYTDPYASSEYREERQQFLVEDPELYENMSKGRYYDVWDRWSNYFTVDELYLYELELDQMIKYPGDQQIADLFSFLSTDEHESKLKYTKILMMLICQQIAGFEQAQRTTTDYDVIKAFPDYTKEIVEMGWDLFSDWADASMISQLAVSFTGTVYDCVDLGIEMYSDYLLYKEAASDYENVKLLLETILNTPDTEKERYVKGDFIEKFFFHDHLVDAATDMLRILEKAKDTLVSVDRTDWEKLTGVVWDNHLLLRYFMVLAESEGLLDEKVLEKNLGILYKGSKYLAPALSKASLAFQATLLAGDALAGTEDVYTFFSEMICISHLCDCLSYAAARNGYDPSRNGASEKDLSNAVVLLEYQLLARARGEHCCRQLILLKKPVLKIVDWLFQNPTDDEINALFDERVDVLSRLYLELQMILCTGNEAYHFYLKEYLAPQYGYADTEFHSFNVGAVDRESSQSLSYKLEEYKNDKLGTQGTGILSMDIRDYDGNHVNDMLVIYVDTADGSSTGVAPIYGKNRAITLRMVLYTMDYTERPKNSSPLSEILGSAISNIKEYMETHHQLITDFFKTWIRIGYDSWLPKDRYTVYDTASVEIAAELGTLCEGGATIGICTMDGIPYIYSAEGMDDYTTYGPSLFRVWHVVDGQFVLDYVDGSMSWGQKTFVNDLNAYFHPVGMDVNGTKLQHFLNLARIRDGHSVFKKDNVDDLKGSILCRIRACIKSAHDMDYQADDYTYMMLALTENEQAAAAARGQEPEWEAPSFDHTKAEALIQEILDKANLEMSLTHISEKDDNTMQYLGYETKSGKTYLSISIDADGTLLNLNLSSPSSERTGEWQKVKDAILGSDLLPFPDSVRQKFAGNCSLRLDQSFDGGTIRTASVDNCILIINLG